MVNLVRRREHFGGLSLIMYCSSRILKLNNCLQCWAGPPGHPHGEHPHHGAGRDNQARAGAGGGVQTGGGRGQGVHWPEVRSGSTPTSGEVIWVNLYITLANANIFVGVRKLSSGSMEGDVRKWYQCEVSKYVLRWDH